MAHNTTHTELQQSAITKEGEFQSNSPAITQTTPIEATSDATTPITAIAETTSNPPTETIIATTTTTTITTTTVDVPSPSPPPPPPSPPPPSPPPPSPPSHPPSPPPPPPPEPKPELTTTTTQDIVTTTAEAPVQTHQPAPTEAITTELAPTYPIETSYIESIYAAPTMAASGSVSPADGLPIGSSVNTKSVSSTTATTTSDCIPSNQEGVCSTTDLASNTMSSGQIAGIAAGAAVFVLLLGACLFIVIRRRRRKNKNRCSKKVSPFFSMNDQEKQTTSNENNSRAVLCQDAIMPEMSESVYGDNLFYSDSADYRRTSSIMNHHAYLPHSTDSQLAMPTSLYPHTAKRRDSYSTCSESTIVMNSKARSYYVTTASAQFHHQKSSPPPPPPPPPQGSLSYVQSARSSGEIDTDNYTLSAMQLFRDSRQTTTTADTRSMVSASIMSDNRKIYRPSLNISSVFQHSPSSSIDSTGHPMVASPPTSSLRFSHRRQESSLDPHILPPKQKMSLWDDHL